MCVPLLLYTILFQIKADFELLYPNKASNFPIRWVAMKEAIHRHAKVSSKLDQKEKAILLTWPSLDSGIKNHISLH